MTNCNRCGATFPTGTLLCPRCQTVQTGVPRAAQAQPVDPTDSRAKLAMILGIPSMVLCCAPVGLVGAGLGVSAVLQARARGRAIPATAVVAIICGGLSAVLLTVGGLSFYRDLKAHDAAVADAKSRLDPKKLSAVQLDTAFACDLVRAFVLDQGAEGSVALKTVDCPQPLTAAGTTASMTGVLVKDPTTVSAKPSTWCFARARRWFVLGSVTTECPQPPFRPELVKPGESTAEADDALETLLREEWAERQDSQDVAQFMGSLTAANTRVADTLEDEETVCPKLDFTGLNPKPGSPEFLIAPTLDLQRLDENVKDTAAFEFLSDERLRGITDTRRKLKERASLLRKHLEKSGPFLTLISTEDRASPEIVKEPGLLAEKMAFQGGYLDGRLSVVDLRGPKILCAANLSFKNSSTVTFRKGRFSSEEAKLKSALDDDLESKFESEARAVIKKLSSGQLRIKDSLFE